MKTTFINFTALDKTQLQGLLFEPTKKKDTIVIHVHGMAGSFYENSFIPIMAEKFTEKDIAFLSFNNRGHDYICDLNRINGSEVESIKGGAAFEIIEESKHDIKGALLYVNKLGYSKVILQGHSSGANKIIYSLSHQEMLVDGIVLLSPCDDVGLHIDEVGEKQGNLVAIAESYINSNAPETLMPENTFFDYLLSAKTYLNFFKNESAFDVFPYRDPCKEFNDFSKVTVPMLITFGTDGEYLLQSAEEVYDILLQKKSDKTNLTLVEIQGASHSYTGKEEVVALKIVDWIDSLYD